MHLTSPAAPSGATRPLLILTFESLDECSLGISAFGLLSKMRQDLIFTCAAFKHGHRQPRVEPHRNARTFRSKRPTKE